MTIDILSEANYMKISKVVSHGKMVNRRKTYLAICLVDFVLFSIYLLSDFLHLNHNLLTDVCFLMWSQRSFLLCNGKGSYTGVKAIDNLFYFLAKQIFLSVFRTLDHRISKSYTEHGTKE